MSHTKQVTFQLLYDRSYEWEGYEAGDNQVFYLELHL